MENYFYVHLLLCRLSGFGFQSAMLKTFPNIFLLSIQCNSQIKNYFSSESYPTKFKYGDINTCFVKRNKFGFVCQIYWIPQLLNSSEKEIFLYVLKFKNKIVMGTKLQEVDMKKTNFSLETKIKDKAVIYDMLISSYELLRLVLT